MRPSRFAHAACLVLAPAALARPFTPGDMYLASASLSGNVAGIVRIDPSAGTASPFLTGAAFASGRCAYDPWRDRLVIPAGATSVTLIDSAGASTPLPYSWATQVTLIAPARDGRLYFFGFPGAGTPPSFLCVDAGGASHAVLDEAGAAGYIFPDAGRITAFGFHAPTNSLVTVSFIPGSATDVKFSRLALSADGSRLAGAPASTIYTVPGVSFPSILNLSEGPGGTVFAKVDDNSGSAAARMLLLDPATMGVSVFATSSYFGVGAEVAGAYSPTTNSAIVLDTLSDFLRRFPPGGSGAGTILPATGVSSAGGSGELSQIIAIAPRACAGDANGDGSVNFFDLNAVLTDFGQSGPALPGDLDHDGDCDFFDLNVVLTYFGGAC